MESFRQSSSWPKACQQAPAVSIPFSKSCSESVAIKVPCPGQGTLMATDSEQLLEKGIETAGACWQAFGQELDWRKDSIDRFFCHQVGKAHAQLLFETLELDPQKNFETLPLLGNVGSVSAPITMAMGIEQSALVPGQRAAILGIGSGINSLMLGVDW